MPELPFEIVAAAFALFFGVACTGKATGRRGWYELARRVSGDRLALPTALIVPSAEAGIAILCIVRPDVGLAGAAFVLALFAGAVALRRDLHGAPCGCFGPLLHSKLGPGLAARNAVLASLAVVAAVGARSATVGPSALLIAFAIAATVAAAVALEQAVSRRRAGPPLGSRQDVDGVPGPAVVLFVVPGCPACERALEHIDALDGVESTVVIGPASEDARATLAASVGRLGRLDLQSLYDSWQIRTTPFAVALDGEKRVVATGLATSAERIEAFARAAAGDPEAAESAFAGLDVPVTRRAVAIGFAQTAVFAFLAGPAGASLRRGLLHLGADDEPKWVRRFRRTVDLPTPRYEERRDNVYRGRHCNGFADMLVDRGVIDHGDDAHRGAGGYTWASGLEARGSDAWKSVKAGVCKRDEQKWENWQGHCPCDDPPVPYYKESVCKADCPHGLLCFGVQCQTDSRQICIRAIVDICIEVDDIVMSVLQWEPSFGRHRPRNAQKCLDIAEAYNQHVRDHEMGHAKRIIDAIESTDSGYKNRSFTACADTEAAARAKIEQQINQTVDRAKKDFFSLEQRETASWHRTDGESYKLDCRPCP